MTNDCHSLYGLCDNIPGSYECSCMTGFSGDGFDCEGKLHIDMYYDVLTKFV